MKRSNEEKKAIAAELTELTVMMLKTQPAFGKEKYEFDKLYKKYTDARAAGEDELAFDLAIETIALLKKLMRQALN